MSRKNLRGFFLTTAISDGSKVSSAILYNCIADNNSGRNDSSGFTINSPGSTMALVDCIAMNSPYGYRAETGSTLELNNCRVLGTTTEKYGSGTINVVNADLLSN